MPKTQANPLDEAGAFPSLDAFFDRQPDDMSDAELDQLVAAMRAERKRFDVKQAKRKDANA